MHIFVFGILGLALGHVAGATSLPASYPAQNFPSAGVKRLVISGVRGRVNVRGNAPGQPYRLNVRHARAGVGDDWGLVVERRGDRLVLEVFNTALGSEWKPLLAKDRFPEFDLDLSGPAVPLVIGWRDGAVDVKTWPAAVDVSLVEGQAAVTAVAAANVQIGRGTAVVRDVAGDVRVRGEEGRLDVRRVRGSASIDWFSGRLNLERLGADLKLTGFDASGVARGGAGAWTIEVPRGRVSVADFSGRLNGHPNGRSAH